MGVVEYTDLQPQVTIKLDSQHDWPWALGQQPRFVWLATEILQKPKGILLLLLE